MFIGEESFQPDFFLSQEEVLCISDGLTSRSQLTIDKGLQNMSHVIHSVAAASVAQVLDL